jgi:hypothetical protein
MFDEAPISCAWDDVRQKSLRDRPILREIAVIAGPDISKSNDRLRSQFTIAAEWAGAASASGQRTSASSALCRDITDLGGSGPAAGQDDDHQHVHDAGEF